jgi:hypothetical protein
LRTAPGTEAALAGGAADVTAAEAAGTALDAGADVAGVAAAVGAALGAAGAGVAAPPHAAAISAAALVATNTDNHLSVRVRMVPSSSSCIARLALLRHCGHQTAAV